MYFKRSLVSIIWKCCFSEKELSEVFVFFPCCCVFRCIEFFFHFVRCRNLAVSSSKYSLFVLSRFCLSAIVVLWRPCFSCGCDHMGYLVPASWEFTTWNIGNPYFINCKPCFFWNETLSNNFIYTTHCFCEQVFVLSEKMSFSILWDSGIFEHFRRFGP